MSMTGTKATMDENDEIIIEKVLFALGEVYRNDYFLIENNCHELSIVGAFYRYFRNEYDNWFKEHFPDVSIDMEYSKMGEELCAKPAPPNNSQDKKHMRIDFVVHKRKFQTRNLLAIEFKLDGREKDVKWDYEKLSAITVKVDDDVVDDKQVRNYELGISIVLEKNAMIMKFFKDGSECYPVRKYNWDGEGWSNWDA